MAQRYREVIESERLTETDKRILDALGEGARTQGYLTRVTDRHRNTISNRLDVLEAGDAIRCVDRPTALYEMANDPREETDG